MVCFEVVTFKIMGMRSRMRGYFGIILWQRKRWVYVLYTILSRRMSHTLIIGHTMVS